MNTILDGTDAERWRTLLIAILPPMGAALLVLLAFWLVLRYTRPLRRRALARAHFADALIDMLVEGLYKGSISIIAIITASSQLGINMGAALAGLGVAGVAIGFAAQETVANMIAGFLVFWDRPSRSATSSPHRTATAGCRRSRCAPRGSARWRTPSS